MLAEASTHEKPQQPLFHFLLCRIVPLAQRQSERGVCYRGRLLRLYFQFIAAMVYLPQLVVFDLDECIWSPEMYTLSEIPSKDDVVMGDLNGKGNGVVGVHSGSEVIRLFPGALQAFQRLLAGEYGDNIRAAAASSADTPLAARIGRTAMGILEVLPGVSMSDAFSQIGGGFGESECNLQIGRSPPLSSNKSTSHFPILQESTGISYSEMLFFDDCNWTDHCASVGRLGVTTQRTPNGMTKSEWEEGMRRFNEQAQARMLRK